MLMCFWSGGGRFVYYRPKWRISTQGDVVTNRAEIDESFWVFSVNFVWENK